jgi:hypothetical protein
MDFESLMGKDLPVWMHVKSDEDLENLSFFKEIYENNRGLILRDKEGVNIPKVIHFIWIGPKPFPAESVKNIQSWVDNHPQWTFKFWTDRPRDLPHPKMQLAKTSDFAFLKLASCYGDSDNFAEKADLLRYEILYQEGGVYADHDVKCLHAFDPLNEAYDFYCGLELPSDTCLSSSVHCTNNLIAVRPGHPILKNCLDWLEEKWQRIGQAYPGNDKEAIINRVAHRTFWAFAESVRNLASKSDFKDMVFPAYYFNASSDDKALMARHLYAGTWFENETKFEKMARERLMLLSKKTNKILLLSSVIGALNFIGLAAVFFTLMKKRSVGASS